LKELERRKLDKVDGWEDGKVENAPYANYNDLYDGESGEVENA